MYEVHPIRSVSCHVVMLVLDSRGVSRIILVVVFYPAGLRLDLVLLDCDSFFVVLQKLETLVPRACACRITWKERKNKMARGLVSFFSVLSPILLLLFFVFILSYICLAHTAMSSKRWPKRATHTHDNKKNTPIQSVRPSYCAVHMYHTGIICVNRYIVVGQPGTNSSNQSVMHFIMRRNNSSTILILYNREYCFCGIYYSSIYTKLVLVL